MFETYIWCIKGYFLRMHDYASVVRDFSQITNPPSPRDLPQLRILKPIRKQRCRLSIHPIWLASLHFRTHRIEVDEPGFEGGLSNGFERFVHLAVELDFVVEGAKDASNSLLF